MFFGPSKSELQEKIKKITNNELSLLRDCAEMFGHTHSDEGELWDEVMEAIKTKECHDIKQLLTECAQRLNNTHCYDTELYKELMDEGY